MSWLSYISGWGHWDSIRAASTLLRTTHSRCCLRGQLWTSLETSFQHDPKKSSPSTASGVGPCCQFDKVTAYWRFLPPPFVSNNLKEMWVSLSKKDTYRPPSPCFTFEFCCTIYVVWLQLLQIISSFFGAELSYFSLPLLWQFKDSVVTWSLTILWKSYNDIQCITYIHAEIPFFLKMQT